MVGPYTVITLYGSTRFKDAFLAAQKRLTLGTCAAASGGFRAWGRYTSPSADSFPGMTT